MNEKLEIIKLLKGQTLEDMYKINIILVHLKEMVDKGIITREDIDNIANLSPKKQQKIIEYVSSKVNNQRRKHERKHNK